MPPKDRAKTDSKDVTVLGVPNRLQRLDGHFRALRFEFAGRAAEAADAKPVGKTVSMPTEEPTRVIAGRYQILELLGRGGMGHVHAGLDRQLDRPIAIKFLRADLADQPALRDRFEREARAAARIVHPNVVGVFDIGEHDGVPYIVMERLSGRTLADELEAGPMSDVRVLTIAADLLAGLGAAHRLGVLHRDIKPGNVLLTDTAPVKLADFGIAKLDDDRHDTTIGSMFGTVSYLAPERLAGQPATRSSDVYSVGVVLFEALTGDAAFRADTPLALARAVAHDQPTFTKEQHRDLDAALIAAVERALAKDPDARFASAEEMAAAITGPLTPAQTPTIRASFADDSDASLASAPASATPTVPVAGASPTATARKPSATAKNPPPVAPTAVLRPDVPRPDVHAPDAGPGGTARPQRTRRGLLAAFLLAIIGIAVVALLLSNLGGGSSRPSTSPSSVPSSAAGSPPAPLARAIDALDQAAR